MKSIKYGSWLCVASLFITIYCGTGVTANVPQNKFKHPGDESGSIQVTISKAGVNPNSLYLPADICGTSWCIQACNKLGCHFVHCNVNSCLCQC